MVNYKKPLRAAIERFRTPRVHHVYVDGAAIVSHEVNLGAGWGRAVQIAYPFDKHWENIPEPTGDLTAPPAEAQGVGPPPPSGFYERRVWSKHELTELVREVLANTAGAR